MEKLRYELVLANLRRGVQMTGQILSLTVNVAIGLLLLAALILALIVIGEYGVEPFKEFYALSYDYWRPYFDAMAKG